MAAEEVVTMLRSDRRLRDVRMIGYGYLVGVLAWPAAIAIAWALDIVKVSW